MTHFTASAFDPIDPTSPTPLYAQISGRLRVAIAAGEVRAGEILPSVRNLATELRINPATVVQAYRKLESEGLVARRHGSGTFVLDVADERRGDDRVREADRLVHEMLEAAARLRIGAHELRAAFERELQGFTGDPQRTNAERQSGLEQEAIQDL
jgi:GntR family transcriptional regulator